MWDDANPSWRSLLEYVHSRTGLTFPPALHADVQERIRRAMQQADIRNPSVYEDFLRHSGPAFDDLVDDITVGETYFFRHPGHFDFLRREVLPSLRQRGMGLQFWSAGCCSGEEAYSLAILVEQEGLAPQTRILGTDISHRALKRAEEGAYTEWSLREMTHDLISSWFHHEHRLFHVADRVRTRVEFKCLNLVLNPYPLMSASSRGFDVIFCRNVLMYFDRATVARVAEGLLGSLAPGGWLLTAPADPPLNDVPGCEVVTTGAGVFYRRSERSPQDIRLMEIPSAELDSFGMLCQTEIEAPAEVVDAHTLALEVRTLANSGDLASAKAAAQQAVQRCPLSPEIHFVHSLVLLGLGNREAAAAAARRALYLDSSLALVHFALGTILQTIGDPESARRAYLNAYRIAAGQPPEQPVPLGDGENAGTLAIAARSQIESLKALVEATCE